MNTRKPTSRKVVLALIYMFLLLVSSIIPMDRQIRGLEFIIELKPTIQNLLHVPMYFVLSVFLLQMFAKSQFGTWKRYFLVLVIAAFFGIVNEVIQIAVPGRYGGTADVVLNIAGALLGIVFFCLVEKSKSGIMRRIVCE
jgi:glycopeptide antibiotics resistance protein